MAPPLQRWAGLRPSPSRWGMRGDPTPTPPLSPPLAARLTRRAASAHVRSFFLFCLSFILLLPGGGGGSGGSTRDLRAGRAGATTVRGGGGGGRVAAAAREDSGAAGEWGRARGDRLARGR